MALMSDGVKAYRVEESGAYVRVDGVLATPEAPAALMEVSAAMAPQGAEFAVVAKTGADLAYGYVNGWTRWIELGRAYGQRSQCVAWVDGRFVFARIGPGGGTLVEHVPAGQSIVTERTRSCFTSQGILQYDEVARDFILTDARRNVSIGPYLLMKAMRLLVAGEVWWYGQATNLDRMMFVRADGRLGVTVGRQYNEPHAVVVRDGFVVNPAQAFMPWLFVDEATMTRPVVERPVWDGWYFSDGRYGTWPKAPGNCSVIVDRGYVSDKPMILSPKDDKTGAEMLADYAAVWSRVVAVSVAHESRKDALAASAAAAREQMRRFNLPMRPVLSYTAGHVWPDAPVEWVGVQLYLTHGSYAEMVALADAQLAKVPANRDIALTVQCYDMNGMSTADLRRLQDAIHEIKRRDRRIRAVLRFAYARPGGAIDHPEIVAGVAASVKATPTPTIETVSGEDDMTINAPRTTFEKFGGRLVNDDGSVVRDGWETILRDDGNPEIGQRVRLFVKNGSLHAEWSNVKGKNTSGLIRKVVP